MFFSVFIIFVIIGTLVGLLAGLLGIGGGLVIVPVLVYVLPTLGVAPELIMPISLATSLATIVFTSMSATRAHHKNHNIPWSVAKQLMFFIAIGAMSGAYIAELLSNETLKNIFAVAVILLASYMLFSIRVTKAKPLPGKVGIGIIGLGTGILSSLMGIAGGAILVPLLTYYSMSIRHAIGTATVCGFVVAVFGATGYVIAGLDQPNLPEWSIGYIYLPALLGVISTSSFVAPIGVKLAAKLPVKTLKKGFAGFLILVAIKMMW